MTAIADRKSENPPNATSNTAGPGLLITEFDEAWYRSRYKDVSSFPAAAENPNFGREHFSKHGRKEQRDAKFLTSRHQLLHLHIPKTAGSSLRIAFTRSKYNVLTVNPNFSYGPAEHANVDVFSGHVGYRVVTEDKSDRLRIITLMRDPVDRVLSYYYHLVQLHDSGSERSERTTLAKKYNLDDFLSIKDHPHLLSDIYNAMTWQLIWSTDIVERMAYRRAERALGDTDLINRATRNLRSFLVVGFQDQMPKFLQDLNDSCGVQLTLGQDNTNDSRLPIDKLSAKTRDRLLEWLHLDLAVYRWARNQFSLD